MEQLKDRGPIRNKMAEKNETPMKEENKKPIEKTEIKSEKKEEKKMETKKEEKQATEEKKSDVKAEEKKEEKPAEAKAEEKKDAKKADVKAKPQISKKDEAMAHGKNLSLSKKHCMYISNFIKMKKIDAAIADLGQVVKLKKVVPFKGEIPHRKGPGLMSGRYPQKAAGVFITLLKGLRGNVLVNGMDLENTRITSSSASWASRPGRKSGARFKRTHVILKAREIKVKDKKPKEKKK